MFNKSYILNNIYIWISFTELIYKIFQTDLYFTGLTYLKIQLQKLTLIYLTKDH